MIKISPSTNPESADNLINYVKEIQNTKAEFLHCDVMDGKFVPATCLSMHELYNISQHSTIALDVHLMVKNPYTMLDSVLKCKPTIVTVHYESFRNKTLLLETLSKIKQNKIMAGLSIKPQTEVSEIIRFLPLCDLILIMSVEPGMSGQKFIKDSIARISQAKDYINTFNPNVKIQVDGGIDENNVLKVHKAGADIAVIGSAVYKQKDRAKFIEEVVNSTI